MSHGIAIALAPVPGVLGAMGGISLPLVAGELLCASALTETAVCLRDVGRVDVAEPNNVPWSLAARFMMRF